MKPFFFLVSLLFMLTMTSAMHSCGSGTQKPEHAHIQDTTKYGALDTATFASGCFWCVEAIFESLRGVKEAESGYSGGHTKNPTYEAVCTHTTGHAEAVQVYYDPTMVSFETLVKVYFNSCDPTQVNGQGPDRGSSYRSILFYRTEKERQIAEEFKRKLDNSSAYILPIAVEIKPFEKFWIAEAYHQNYERNHPDNAYVRNVSIPRLNKMKERFPDLLK